MLDRKSISPNVCWSLIVEIAQNNSYPYIFLRHSRVVSFKIKPHDLMQIIIFFQQPQKNR